MLSYTIAIKNDKSNNNSYVLTALVQFYYEIM